MSSVFILELFPLPYVCPLRPFSDAFASFKLALGVTQSSTITGLSPRTHKQTETTDPRGREAVAPGSFATAQILVRLYVLRLPSARRIARPTCHGVARIRYRYKKKKNNQVRLRIPCSEEAKQNLFARKRHQTESGERLIENSGNRARSQLAHREVSARLSSTKKGKKWRNLTIQTRTIHKSE